MFFFFFFQAEDGIRDKLVTGVQTCALPISFLLFHRLRRERAERPGMFLGKLRSDEIGRASCRERVEISVVAVSLKKKRETEVPQTIGTHLPHYNSHDHFRPN